MQIRLGYNKGYAFLSFKYNKEIIDIIKEYGDSFYDWKEKYWRINLSTKDILIKKLEEKGHNVIINQKFKKIFIDDTNVDM